MALTGAQAMKQLSEEITEYQTRNLELKKDLAEVNEQIATWIQNKNKAKEELARAVCEERHENTVANCIATLRESQVVLNRLFTRRQDLQITKNELGVCHQCGRHD